jgi:hypothetical protein
MSFLQKLTQLMPFKTINPIYNGNSESKLKDYQDHLGDHLVNSMHVFF